MVYERNYTPLPTGKTIAQIHTLIKNLGIIDKKSIIGIEDYFNPKNENEETHRVSFVINHNGHDLEVQLIEFNCADIDNVKFTDAQKSALQILSNVYSITEKTVRTLLFVRNVAHKKFDNTTKNTEFHFINNLCEQIETLDENSDTKDFACSILPILIQLISTLNSVPVKTKCKI